jgi:hypothetical protein
MPVHLPAYGYEGRRGVGNRFTRYNPLLDTRRCTDIAQTVAAGLCPLDEGLVYLSGHGPNFGFYNTRRCYAKYNAERDHNMLSSEELRYAMPPPIQEPVLAWCGTALQGSAEALHMAAHAAPTIFSSVPRAIFSSVPRDMQASGAEEPGRFADAAKDPDEASDGSADARRTAHRCPFDHVDDSELVGTSPTSMLSGTNWRSGRPAQRGPTKVVTMAPQDPTGN